MKVYPIKFNPILKERIWGGEKLMKTFKKDSKKSNIGESWEISDVKGDVSIVSNGVFQGRSLKELISEFKGEFVGHRVYNLFGDNFPILIKFIDAKTPLSIQVHPNNELARKRHNSFGKNEMWYVMDVENDGELVVGFNKEVTKLQYVNALQTGKILDILNLEKVRKGDTFYIPTGRVHAIGAGTVIAEVQQTSDITYRIYDYERVDVTTGEPRELHTDLAIDAIDYSLSSDYKANYELRENKFTQLVHSPYFKTDILKLKGCVNLNYKNTDSFIIYMCVEGMFSIVCDGEKTNVNIGETIMLPATTQEVIVNSENAMVLEVTL